MANLAHACIVLSIVWFFVAVIGSLLHCRPLYYNWMTPAEDPRYCFSLKHYSIVMAAWGLVLDSAIWLLPHFVIWTLQLRLAHKVAITTIFAFSLLYDNLKVLLYLRFAKPTYSNIVIGAFRITSLFHLALHRDLTYEAVPAMIWVIAQESTAIMLACCPLLRPLFDKLLPRRLTRVNSATTESSTRPAAICCTTKIVVYPNSSRPRVSHNCFNDEMQESQRPTFQIKGRHRGPFCGGICCGC